MKPETTYGLTCARKDEKVLMQRVNAYLATFDRTTSKVRNPTLLADFAPSVLKHFYFNLNKDTATYLEIRPNEDVNGRLFFPGHPECGWLVRARIDPGTFPAGTQEKAEEFIRGVLAAAQNPSVVLEEKDEL